MGSLLDPLIFHTPSTATVARTCFVGPRLFPMGKERPRTYKTGPRPAWFSLSKTQDGQPRNIPKVPGIRRAYAVTKFECGHTD